MARFQLLPQPYNNVFPYSIYGTGREVERSNSQVDWDSDVTRKGHAVINVQPAYLTQRS